MNSVKCYLGGTYGRPAKRVHGVPLYLHFTISHLWVSFPSKRIVHFLIQKWRVPVHVKAPFSYRAASMQSGLSHERNVRLSVPLSVCMSVCLENA